MKEYTMGPVEIALLPLQNVSWVMNLDCCGWADIDIFMPCDSDHCEGEVHNNCGCVITESTCGGMMKLDAMIDRAIKRYQERVKA